MTARVPYGGFRRTGITITSRRNFATVLAAAPATLIARKGGAAPVPHAADMVIDVTAFGAVGDGETDDAPAINAAIAAARQRQRRIGNYTFGCRIVFPTGFYAVHSSINMTELRAINTVIDGAGSAIIGRCAGQPVVDALGSRWLTMRDLTIVGDAAAVPSVGLQIGLVSENIVADDHWFGNIKILGHFSLACLYNRSAETTAFEHLLLWNDEPGSYCLIQDGMNYFSVKSTFVQVNIPRNHELSFNENIFINCDFRQGGGGTPVWLGDTARHAFVRCYSATNKGPSFIIYCGSNSHTMLDIDCHCEEEGLQDVFHISSASKTVCVAGFAYREHNSFAKHALFSCDEHITQVQIEHAQLEVALYRYKTCNVFDLPALWVVSGTYYSADKAAWNGNDAFSGMLYLGTRAKMIEKVGI